MTYVMFVQNGYLLLPSADIETLRACYRNAALVLSISDDTSNLVLSLGGGVGGRVLVFRGTGLTHQLDVRAHLTVGTTWE